MLVESEGGDALATPGETPALQLPSPMTRQQYSFLPVFQKPLQLEKRR